MIKSTFRLGGDLVETIIDGNNLMFSDTQSGTITTIEGIKLNQQGVIEEFPDLKDKKDWKKEAIKRFKEHLKKMNTEMKKNDYVISELKKHGYTPLFYQRGGFRPVKIK